MSAIVLDFNKELLNFDEKPFMERLTPDAPETPVMINKLLANNLSGAPTGGMKVFHWSLDLWKTGKLILDKTDRDLLKDMVLKLQVSNLVQGRIVTIIEDAEKAAEAKKTEPETELKAVPSKNVKARELTNQ